jgi:hypothetical protein
VGVAAAVVVVLLVEAALAEAEELPAAEVELASADPPSVVVRRFPLAEACVSVIRAPGNSVLRG